MNRFDNLMKDCERWRFMKVIFLLKYCTNGRRFLLLFYQHYLLCFTRRVSKLRGMKKLLKRYYKACRKVLLQFWQWLMESGYCNTFYSVHHACYKWHRHSIFIQTVNFRATLVGSFSGVEFAVRVANYFSFALEY